MKELISRSKNLMSSGIWRADKTKVLLSIILVAVVFLPLVRMFSFMEGESIRRVIGAPNFGVAVRNSLVSAALGTIVTVCIAFFLAVCIQRTTILRKELFEIIFLLPMLIPSISIGMGLVILLGNNGLLTKVLSLQRSIYGLSGIVLGSTMYAFPVAYLMIADIVKYEDGSPYEAAQVLGLPRWRQFTAIMLPYLRRPMISVVFSVFAMIITDYGVPLMVGGKYMTIATVMYQEVIGQLDFGKGAVYGSVLLVPAVFAFAIDILVKDKGNSGYVTKPCAKLSGTATKWVSYIYCGLISLLTLLPLAAFLILAFAENYPNDLTITLANVNKALNLKVGTYLLNSVIIATCTATIGVVLAFVIAYLSARMKSGVSRFLHLSSMTSAAIPGIVLGLSYVLTFNKTPIYGTIIILIIVNVVHFIASPYLMAYNSLSKINKNLESVAQTMGISRIHVVRDVLVPQCKGTILEMFSYFFVNCMMTISAVSFLATTATKPVSLMINQFEAQMQYECAAVVSIAILCVNIIVKIAVRFAAKNIRKNIDRGDK